MVVRTITDSSYAVRPDKHTSTQIDNLSVEDGVVVFDTDVKVNKYYNGTEWVDVEVKSGTAQLDFGNGSKTSEVVVTGVLSTTSTSKIMASMRIEATDSHSIDDLLIDPIRLATKDFVSGVGFTIYGAMDNASANGLYKIDWYLIN